jgi:hypothetical protein
MLSACFEDKRKGYRVDCGGRRTLSLFAGKLVLAGMLLSLEVP